MYVCTNIKLKNQTHGLDQGHTVGAGTIYLGAHGGSWQPNTDLEKAIFLNHGQSDGDIVE